MAVALVTKSSAYNQAGAATSYNNILNMTAIGGADHILVIGTTFGGNPGAFTTKTWNGTAMSQIGSTVNNGTNNYAAIFYLMNPAAGANNFNLVWTNSVTNAPAAGAEFSGVDTGTPISDFTSATGTSQFPAVTVPSASGDAMLDVFTTNGTSYASNTQTLIGSDNTFYTCAASVGLASGASITDTYTTFGSQAWLAAGVRIRQTAIAAIIQRPRTVTPALPWMAI